MKKRWNLGTRWKAVLGCLLLSPMWGACGDAESAAPSGELGQEESSERPARFELSSAGMANLNLRVSVVGPGTLAGKRSYPGVVRYKQTTRAALVSQVEGVVQGLSVELGQTVSAGDTVCVIHSRGLAQARSTFLEALHKAEFAERLFQTEKELWEKQITSRESYLRAEHELGDARLSLDTAKHELLALGLGLADLEILQEGSAVHHQSEESVDLSQLRFTSPIDGQVVAVGASQGEWVGPGEDLVEVADLALVWVDTQVPVRELARMEIGNRVRVRWNGADLEALGTIAYLAPEIDSASQTGLARIELPNPNGMWRPGLFVDVQAEVNPEVVPLSLPTSALVADPDAPGQFVVFVGLEPGHFEARPVKVLRSEDGVVAVQGDLKPGDHVAAGDTLFLKAVWMGEGGMEE